MSTPVTAASEGTAYSYAIQTSPSANVTLALNTSPQGATLSGNTLTWTPSSTQSRVPSQFSVTATTSGGTSTQTWSVTPAGTIHGTWINTYPTTTGTVSVPISFLPGYPNALIPQANGSFLMIAGSSNANGTFTIPNVPSGYYWLQTSALVDFWTSSSTFDLGFNSTSPLPVGISPPLPSPTMLSFSLSGLDPLQASDKFMFLWDAGSRYADPFPLLLPGSLTPGATTLSTTQLGPTLGSSQTGTGFVMQYQSEALGPLNGFKLVSNATIPNLTLTSGATDNINTAMNLSPQQSIDLNVKGSAWAALFNNAGPSALSQESTGMTIAAQAPTATVGTTPAVSGGLTVALLFDSPSSSSLVSFSSSGSSSSPSLCNGAIALSGLSGLAQSPQPIITDQDLGLVQYGDPFPVSWRRTFTYCEAFSVSLPFPGSTTPVPLYILDTQSTALPTSQIAPLIGQVQNPTVNGMSLFAANTVSATGITLNWNPPQGAIPTGYKVAVYIATSLGSVPIQLYEQAEAVYTTKTSVTLPPVASIQSGDTIVFEITAVLDGAANFETQPNRTALPTASVSVVSAPITISGS